MWSQLSYGFTSWCLDLTLNRNSCCRFSNLAHYAEYRTPKTNPQKIYPNSFIGEIFIFFSYIFLFKNVSMLPSEGGFYLFSFFVSCSGIVDSEWLLFEPGYLLEVS